MVRDLAPILTKRLVSQVGSEMAIAAIYLWTESLEKSLDIFIIVVS
jgi:uncharacterized protein involved in tolerance to divalent cations